MSRLGANVTAGHHFTRFLKLKNYNPTQGELFIMVNKEQNKAGSWMATRARHERLLSEERSESWPQPIYQDMTETPYTAAVEESDIRALETPAAEQLDQLMAEADEALGRVDGAGTGDDSSTAQLLTPTNTEQGK